MDTDTYRYLMSALMQVFGALVALDAIFLVFQQQAMAALKAKTLFQLGRYDSLFDPIYAKSALDWKTRADIAMRAAPVFETLSHAQIDARITLTEAQVVSRHEQLAQELKTAKILRAQRGNPPGFMAESMAEDALEQHNRILSLWHHQTRQYSDILDKEERVPTLLAATMGVPSALVILFAIMLCPAGRMCQAATAWCGGASIVLSTGGLLFLVQTAFKTMRWPEHPENPKVNPAPSRE